MESLDKLFENVCELDLIFGFETLHAVLGEMVIGGVVVETSMDKIVDGVRSSEGTKGKRRAVNARDSGGSLGRAGGAFVGLGWATGGTGSAWR